MTDTYRDVKGVAIKAGDILKYDEGPWNGRSLDEVVDINGELHAAIRIGRPTWSVLTDESPTLLKYYRAIAHDPASPLMHVEKIGNVRDNPEMLTAEYAAKLWPLGRNE